MEITKQVDLNSYTCSKGYCGFFAYKNKNIKRGANIALNFLWSHFEDQLFPVEIFSSLWTSCNDSDLEINYEYSADEIRQILSPALTSLPPFVLRRDCEPEIFQKIALSPTTEKGLYGACFSVMALGGIRGHLFIHLEHNKVLLYPHDDVGFGVISTTPNTGRAVSFLESVDLSEFEVTMRQANNKTEA